MSPSIYQRVRGYIETALSGQRVAYEHRVVDRFSKERYIHVTYVPHISAEQQVLGFFTFLQDSNC